MTDTIPRPVAFLAAVAAAAAVLALLAGGAAVDPVGGPTGATATAEATSADGSEPLRGAASGSLATQPGSIPASQLQDTSTVEIVALEPRNASVAVGADVTVNATVRHGGATVGERTVELTVFDGNGTVVSSETEDTDALDLGGTETVQFDVDTDDVGVGAYDLRVEAGDDVENGSLAVYDTATVAGNVTVDVADPADPPTVDVRVRDGRSVVANDTVELGEGGNASYALGGIEVVEERNVTVVANATDYERTIGDVAVAPNGTADHDVHLVRHSRSVDGSVVDGDGEPVSNASVGLVHFSENASGTWDQSNETRPDGAFTLSDVPVGNHSIAVEAEGYLDGNTTVTVTTNEPAAPSVELLERARFAVANASASGEVVQGEIATVSATVTNAGDVPGNESVWLEVEGDRIDEVNESLDGGENATVSFDWNTSSVSDGTYEATVATEDGNSTTNVTVLEPAEVVVTDVAANETVDVGDSLAVDVTVENVGGTNGSGTAELTLVGPNGSVAQNTTLPVDDLAPGATETLDVALNTTGLEPGEYVVDAVADGVGTNATVVVRSTGTLSATVSLDVVGPDEVVPVDVAVVAGNETVVENTTDVDASGATVTFDDLAAGEYAVVADAEAYDATETTVTADGESGAEVILDLERHTGSVLANVTADGGEPIEDATVDLHYFGENGTVPTNETATDGTQVFVDVPVGNHSISASAEGYVPNDSSVAVTDGNETVVDLALDHEPSPDLHVSAVAPDGERFAVDETVTVNATLANDGDAEATESVVLNVTDRPERSHVAENVPVPPHDNRSVTFDLDASDLGAGEYDYVVTAGNATAEGSFTVVANASIAGSVSLDVVDPTANVMVEVTTNATDATEPVDVDDGVAEFEVGGIEVAADRPVTVEASAANYATNETTVVVGPDGRDDVSLQLDRLTTGVEGTVEDEDGGAVPNATVELHEFGTETAGEVHDAEMFMNGGFSLDGVPVGDHEIVVTADGFLNATANVTAETGTSDPVTLELERRGAPEFAVVDLDPDELTLEVDDTSTLNATVRNDGDADGSQTVTLNVTSADGATAVVRNGTQVDLAAGANETVQFDLDATDFDAGEYVATVGTENDSAAANLTVGGEASIAGTVALEPAVDATDVTIAVNGTDAETTVMVDDGSQTFDLPNLSVVEPTAVTVAANATDYAPNETTVTVEPSDEVGDVDLELARLTGAVEVTVSDQDDEAPIDRADVELSYFDGDDWPTLERSTDGDGTVSFEDVPVGNHTLYVDHEYFANSSIDVVVTAGETTGREIALEGDRPATFVVQDHEPGEAILDHNDTVSVNATVQNVGDESGEIDLELTVVSSGNSPGTGAVQTVELAPEETRTVEYEVNASDLDVDGYTYLFRSRDDLRLLAAGTLTVLTDESPTVGLSLDTADPGENATASIAVRNRTHTLTTRNVTVIEENATLVLEDVEPDAGDVTIEANAPNYANVSVNETLDRTSTTHIDLSLTRFTGAVNGTVVDEDGDPVANETVRLHGFGEDADAETWTTETTANGTFAYERVPVGDHEVTVDADGFDRAVESVAVEPNASVALDVELEETDDGNDDNGGSSGGGIGPPGGGSPSPTEPPASPDLRLDEVTPTDATVEAGEPVELTAVVANVGDEAGSTTVVITVGDETVLRESVSVAADDTETVTYEVATDDLEPDVYRTEVEAADEDVVGALYVTEASGGESGNGREDDDGEEPAPSDDGDDGDGLPGFGVLAALVALALVAARRRPRR